MEHGQTTRVAGVGAAVGVVTVGFALLCLLGGGCARELEGTPSPVRKTHLGELPGDHRRRSVAISSGGDAYAFVSTTPEGDRVVGPDGPGPLYARCERPLFGPEGQRVYYWAQPHADPSEAGPEDAPRDTFVLVADRTPLATGFRSPGTLVLSDDGARWAALGIDGNVPETSLLFFLDGERQEDWLDVSQPVFGPADGDAAGVVVMLAKGADGAVRLVVDGQERQRFAAPEVACAVDAMPEEGEPDLWRHVVQPLADGGFLLGTRDADGWGLYREDRRLASYELSFRDAASTKCLTGKSVLLLEYVRAARDAPVAIWWERGRLGEEGRWRVMRDGTPIDEYRCDDILRSQPPEIGPGGEHYAYACIARDADGSTKITVVQDGVRHGPYAEVWGLALSDDGEHLAYGAIEVPVPIDGASGSGELPELPWSFYRDGQRQPGQHHALWRPRLNADGSHMAWQAQVAEGSAGVLGVDHRRITDFDELLWGPTFEGDDRVAWVIRRGRRLTRIDFTYGLD